MPSQIGILGHRAITAVLGAAFVLSWSSGFIGAKLGSTEAPVITLILWRFLPLALLLLPIVVWNGRSGIHLAGSGLRALGREVLVGALSQSGYLLAVYWAIGLGVSAGTTALIDGIQPLVAAALVGPLLGLAVSLRQWLGLGLGLIGVVLVTLADAAAGQVTWWYYLIPFVGMLSLVAATFVRQRARGSVPPLAALTIHCSTTAVIFTVLALATGAARPPASGGFWLTVVWLIVLSTLGGYGLYWMLLRRIGVTAVNTLMFLMAPVTAVWGTLMFDEPFSARTAAGLGLGLLAVVVVYAGESRDSKPRRMELVG